MNLGFKRNRAAPRIINLLKFFMVEIFQIFKFFMVVLIVFYKDVNIALFDKFSNVLNCVFHIAETA